MKVLITGGNGLIGSHLAERLIDRGDSVALYDLEFNSNTDNMDCERIVGDVKNHSDLLSAIEGKDTVFHFAAVSRVVWGQQDPFNCWQTNSMGTVNVLEGCRKAESKPTVFYASSREVYGDPKYFPVDEAHPKNPKSVYGTTKLNAENSCLSYCNMLGLPVVIFRFSNVYGSERDRLERVIPKFMIQALRGEDIMLYGGGQILDFTFIDDTVDGIFAAYDANLNADRKLSGQDFHFVTGRGVSVGDLAKMIVELAGSSSKITRIESKSFDVAKFIGDPSKSNRILGYRPKVTLEEGLKILKERVFPIINSVRFSD